MKKHRVVFASLFATFVLLLSGYLIACCIISVQTSEPLRTQLDYMDESTVMLVWVIITVLVAAAMFLLFCVSGFDTIITDDELKQLVEEKARQLLQEASDK